MLTPTIGFMCLLLAPAALADDAGLESVKAVLSTSGRNASKLEAWPNLKPSHGHAFLQAGAVYLVLDELPQDGKISIPRLNNVSPAIYVLSDAAKTPLKLRPTPNVWTITLPKKLRPGKPLVMVLPALLHFMLAQLLTDL